MKDWSFDKIVQAIISIGVIGVTLAVLAFYALQGVGWAITTLTGAFLAVLAFWGFEVHLNQSATRALKKAGVK